MRQAIGRIMTALLLLSPATAPETARVLAVEPEPLATPTPVASGGASGAPAASAPRPDDGRCDRCGCGACVRRVPVAKPVTREIKKVCWDAREEELIVPGPSCLCGRRHGRDACGCFWWNIWKPTWARVVTRTVPVKREVTRKVPGCEWTLEERCRRCRHDRRPTDAADSDAAPLGDRSGPTTTD
jgi:hypothetical protein